MKQYKLVEWQQVVNRAKAHLNSACPLIEDEVVVEVAERLEKLEAFVQWIARDYVESSHDKVRLQRDDYIKHAKELLDELYEEE
jgi:hypothetical protein